MRRVLVVSDPVISAQPLHGDALAALADAGLAVARFDECDIDARCSHSDEQGERVRREGLDGVVCIGGGSVMCTGKGIAIVATNHKPMRECTGVGRFSTKALPMIMVPTTAGSGSEVRSGRSSRTRSATSSCWAAARSASPMRRFSIPSPSARCPCTSRCCPPWMRSPTGSRPTSAASPRR